MTFLYWNIHKNQNLFPLIQKLMIERDVDILMIAEYPLVSPLELLYKINELNDKYEYIKPIISNEKVKIYSKNDVKSLDNWEDEVGISAKRLYSTVLKQYVTLIVCHLPSKVNNSDSNLSELSEDIKEFIDRVEDKAQHQRTIVCGDLNMNPFDEGLIKTRGLHAVMERKIASKKTATVSGKKYHFFYNPMWSFLGDMGKGKVCGTMYYNSSKPINYYWHLYDQVLMRPEMIPFFIDSGLDILTEISGDNLITQNNIIDSKYSDHLPLLFNFNI